MRWVFLFLFGVLLAAQGNAEPLQAVAMSQKVLWHWKSVVLHANGLAVTPDLSDFHVLRVHARDLTVVSSTVCAEDDAECLDANGDRTLIGALKVGDTLYRLKGNVEYDTEGRVSSVDADLYGLDTPYRCLVDISGEPLCGEEPGEPLGHISVEVHHDFEGFDYVAVGTLNLDGKDYIVGFRGWKRVLSPERLQVRSLQVKSVGGNQ